MRRADRLFQIVQLLQRRRSATTAARIADRLGVFERTVYRDIQDLVAAGTPIDGEAGIGYRLRPGYDLPPLMFDRDEIHALVLGVRIVRQFGDPGLARASDTILDKVATVLPTDLQPLVSETPLYVPQIRSRSSAAGDVLSLTREALTATTQAEAALRERERRRDESDGSAGRRLLLGPRLDAGRVVRAAGRLQELQARSRQRSGTDGQVRGRARAHAQGSARALRAGGRPAAGAISGPVAAPALAHELRPHSVTVIRLKTR